MEKQILVPLDFSEVSGEVVKIADEWAQRTKANLHFLHIVPDSLENEEKNLDFFLQNFEYFLSQFNIVAHYQTYLRLGNSKFQIMEAVNDIKPNLIIMAAHSHTMLGRFFLGSNTDYVLLHCHCPVYVYKAHPRKFDNKIIVPLDYTAINKTVIRLADEWTQRNNSELYFIHAEPIPEYQGGQFAMESGFYQNGDNELVAEEDSSERQKNISKLKNTFETFIDPLEMKSKFQSVFEFGKPYLKIKELQEKTNAGLVIIAAHSHTLIDRIFIGSNTKYLMHHLNCPMYIYKEMHE